VKVDFMMLANHAEVNNGLFYISGGTWDTTNVQATPPPGALPEDAVAVIQGTLAVRVLFHITETERDHGFAVTIMDEDGEQVVTIEGGGPVPRMADVPPGWDQGLNLAVPLSGIPLKRFGLYTVSLQVDGQHVADRPFRVLKAY
jgi:hypothetical protein